MLAALAFSHLKHTESWFKLLQISSQDFEFGEIVDYFEEIFLGHLDKIESRRKIRFHLVAWNVFHRTIEHQPRTNNAIEVLYRFFASMLQNNQPDVRKFLMAIYRQQVLQEIVMALQRGEVHF